jgi:transcriptional regulator with XRE-family HTH domain
MLSMDTIGDRIRQARVAAGIRTQQQLADAVGVTRSAVSQWESGTSQHVKPEHLAAIAEACSVEMRWLATGRGPREGLSVRDLEWLELGRAARPRDRQAIWDLLVPRNEPNGPADSADKSS